MTDTNLDKEQKKNQQLEKLKNEDSHSTKSTSGSGCERCNKSGDFFLLPLRYAVLGKAEDVIPVPLSDKVGKNLTPSSMSSQLGKGVTELKLKSADYTVRMLRAGFLYILVEPKSEESYWRAFSVTKEGALFESKPENMPSEIPTFSCDLNSDGVNASVVAFNNISDINALYILFNPNKLTMKKLDYYKNTGKSSLQCIVPQAKTMQPHAIAPDDLEEQLAEAALSSVFSQSSYYNPSIQEYQKYLSLVPPPGNDTFTALKTFVRHSVYEETPGVRTLAAYTNQLYPMEKFMDSLGRYQGLVSQLNKHNGIAFVLHDAIGITQELCNWRNDSIESTIKPWLEQEDNKKIKNSHKLQTASLISEIEKSFVNNRAWSGYDNYEKNILDRNKEVLEEFKKRHNMDREDFEAILKRNKEANIEPAIKEKIKSGVYNKQFEEKYLKYLNNEKLATFKAEVSAIEKRAENFASKRTQDHLLWLSGNNKPLLAGLRCYDEDDLEQGLNFSHQTGLCTLGLIGSIEGAALLNKWWAERDVSEGNLCWRSYCYNQNSVIAEIKKVMSEAYSQSSTTNNTVFTASNIDSDKFSSIITAEDVLYNGKMLPDFFDKLNGYISTQYPQHYFAPGFLGWVTIQGRALLGASKVASGQGVSPLFRLLNYTMRATLGPKAVSLKMQQGGGGNPGTHRAQYNKEITKGIESLKNAHSDQYYRVRLSTSIAFLEAALLLVRASQLPEGSREYAMLVSSALMTTAAVLEFHALGLEVLMGYYSGGEVRAVTEIRFGQIKLFSAGLGTVAGIIAAYWDFSDAAVSWKKQNFSLFYIYMIRGLGTIALVTNQLGIAIGLANPWFTKLLAEARIKNQAFRIFGYELLKKLAVRYATEQAIAVLTSRVWILTVFIIALTGLVWIFSDSELESWMKKCCFRAEEKNDGYKDAAEEYEAATMILIMGDE